MTHGSTLRVLYCSTAEQQACICFAHFLQNGFLCLVVVVSLVKSAVYNSKLSARPKASFVTEQYPLL